MMPTDTDNSHRCATGVAVTKSISSSPPPQPRGAQHETGATTSPLLPARRSGRPGPLRHFGAFLALLAGLVAAGVASAQSPGVSLSKTRVTVHEASVHAFFTINLDTDPARGMSHRLLNFF